MISLRERFGTGVKEDPNLDGDLDQPLPEARVRTRKMTKSSWVLVGLVFAAAAFWAGVKVEKSQAGTAASPFGAGGLPNFAALAGGGGLPGRPTGAAGVGAGTPSANVQSTTGQVKLIDGANIYVTDAGGNTVKLVTSSASKITTSSAASTSDLKIGATISATGTPNADGSVSASAVVLAADSTPTTTRAQ